MKFALKGFTRRSILKFAESGIREALCFHPEVICSDGLQIAIKAFQLIPHQIGLDLSEFLHLIRLITDSSGDAGRVESALVDYNNPFEPAHR